MILEEHVEEAVKGVINANATIIRLVVHGLEVRDWRDNSASKTGRMVVVHAEPAERIAPNYNKWRIPVSAVAATHQADDKSRAVCEEAYKAVQTALAGTDKTALTAKLPAGATATIDGIVMRQGEEGFDESHQMLAAKADIYATIAP